MTHLDVIHLALQRALQSECLHPLTTNSETKTQFFGIMDHVRDQVNLAFFNTQHIANLWETLRASSVHGSEEDSLLVLRLLQRFQFYFETLAPPHMDWVTYVTTALQTSVTFHGIDDVNMKAIEGAEKVHKEVSANPWFAFLVLCDLTHYDIKQWAVAETAT